MDALNVTSANTIPDVEEEDEQPLACYEEIGGPEKDDAGTGRRLMTSRDGDIGPAFSESCDKKSSTRSNDAVTPQQQNTIADEGMSTLAPQQTSSPPPQSLSISTKPEVSSAKGLSLSQRPASGDKKSESTGTMSATVIMESEASGRAEDATRSSRRKTDAVKREDSDKELADISSAKADDANVDQRRGVSASKGSSSGPYYSSTVYSANRPRRAVTSTLTFATAPTTTVAKKSTGGRAASHVAVEKEERTSSNTRHSSGNSTFGPPVVYDDGTNGCLTCGADDDHANLLICEYCNAEYHTYCLDPPLRTVPDGDFLCDQCKVFFQDENDSDEDGLDAMVDALAPKFTSRFGEIVWAAGGNGFGWWPACIYDPRLTVGTARSLAKKHLGKKHLVYFFECHDAPFTVLGNAKMTPWEDGFQEEYDLGKTARGAGKARVNMFERALQVATLEHDKPLDLRMDWNHSLIEPGQSDKRTSPQTELTSTASSSKRKRGAEGAGPAVKQGKRSKASSSDAGSNVPPPDEPPGETSAKGSPLIVSRRNNLQAALDALPSISNGATEIEPSDGPLYCKLLMKGMDGSDAQSNVGFVVLSSRRSSTFAEARRQMNCDLDDGCLPDHWKFYAPKLGPVSRKQESNLSVLEFLSSTTRDVRLGDGSSHNPLRLILQEFGGNEGRAARSMTDVESHGATH